MLCWRVTFFVYLHTVLFSATQGLKGANSTECKDEEKPCDYYWSRGWYSCNNGAALWRYCPQRCGLCGETVCSNKRKSCDIIAKFGYCQTHPSYTKRHCAKSCKFCSVPKKPKLIPGCRDYEPKCSTWISRDECRTNPDTRELCPKGCGICGRKKKVHKWRKCKDRLTAKFCRSKVTCISEQTKSKTHCKKTCEMCKQDGRCYDDLSYCWWYLQRGDCQKEVYKKFMTKHCRYSCNFC